MQEELKNPFYYLYHWCEGELLDIQALLTAISQRDKSDALMKKNEKTKAGVEKEIEAAKAGRKTVKNMFKKENNVEKMDQKAENVSRFINVLYQLISIMFLFICNQLMIFIYLSNALISFGKSLIIFRLF